MKCCSKYFLKTLCPVLNWGRHYSFFKLAWCTSILLWYTIFLRKQVFSMKYIFTASWNSYFNYLVSRTCILRKIGTVKSKDNTAKMKAIFEIMIPCSWHWSDSKTYNFYKNYRKYAGASLDWSLEINIAKPVPFRLVFKWSASCIFSFAVFRLKELRLTWIAKNHHFFKQEQLIDWKSILVGCKRRLLQMLNRNPCDMHLLWQQCLKKSLFGVAYRTREHTILNHKNSKFCTFSVYLKT